MIEFAKNAASTRYVIFVNQNCSDPLRRSAANTRQPLFVCSRTVDPPDWFCSAWIVSAPCVDARSLLLL